MQSFQKREPAMVLVYSIISCGIYGIYWWYQTMIQVNELSGKEQLNPILMLVLSIVCFPVSFYVMYVIDQTLMAEAPKKNVPYNSSFLLWILLSFLAGAGGIVAMFQIQTALNQIGERP